MGPENERSHASDDRKGRDGESDALIEAEMTPDLFHLFEKTFHEWIESVSQS
jgi:hypothetical protein